MKIKRFFQSAWDRWKIIWQTGNIQKASRITYDVTWNIILFFLVIGFLGIIFVSAIGVGYFASLVKDEPIRSYASMKKDIYDYEETSKLYFSDEKYIGDIRSDLHREEVSLNEVSDHVINAVIATEDENFYEHDGIVPKAIVRALLQEVIDTGKQSGGSTLTQQLIKNQILTNEVSFERKAKEILLALRLEKFFDKDEILEAYLNVIPYGRNSSGQNIAGIQTAAKGIFDLDASELNLPQAAFIAGLPQSPSVYTPFLNTGGLKDEESLQPGLQRMKVVLKRMLDADMISEEEYKDALEYDIVNDFAKPKKSPSEKYGYLTDELEDRAKKIIKKVLATDDGYTLEDIENDETLNEQYTMLADRALRRNGYHIHSTIDKDIYDAMQKAAKNYEHYESDIINEAGEAESVQASGVLIENHTGKIISFIGGREYSQKNQLNYATKAKRPFGSTIKPLLVYATGMELGEFQPGSPIADIKTEYEIPGQEPYIPSNYEDTNYYGINSMRKALAHSYNVSAVRAYDKLRDRDEPKNNMKKLGIRGNYEYSHIAAPLGTDDVSVLENTNAFAALGNQGTYTDAYMIEKITTKDGEIIYEHEPETNEVFSPQTAYLTIDMMRDVITEGTATSLPKYINNPSVDWAGKTGTSDDHEDAWFIGLNPNVTFGAWLGFDSPTDLKKQCAHCPIHHGERVIKFWSEMLNTAADINPELVFPEESFERPDGIVERKYCAISGKLPSKLCEKAGLVKSDLFNIEHVPTEKDDSLISGEYVKTDENSVIAHDQTPEEFIDSDGLAFNPKFLEENGYDELDDISELYPLSDERKLWEKIKEPLTESDPKKDNDKQPSSPTNITIKDDQLTWNESKSSDVVGYYIYESTKGDGDFKQIDHTKKTTFDLSKENAIYYVTAIDLFGQESKPSKEVTIGEVDQKDDDDNDNNDS